MKYRTDGSLERTQGLAGNTTRENAVTLHEQLVYSLLHSNRSAAFGTNELGSSK